MIERSLGTTARLAIVLALLAGLGFAAFELTAPVGDPTACAALARARVIRVYADADVSLSCPGVERDSLDDSAVARALDGDDPRALAAALTKEKGSAVAVLPGQRKRGVGGELARLQHVGGLRGVVLAAKAAVYVAKAEPQIGMRERDALAYVARALFRGAREPSINSFPPSLRRVERDEVMVTLSDHGDRLLWRSARGTSIARALLTATRVARDRWHEHESAMGGSLSKRLPQLDVEVGLLSEDGTIVDKQPSFVDRAITEAHGIGFDYRTNWHYLLPGEVLSRGRGSAHRALLSLAGERSVPVSAFQESGTRVYRFVETLLGASRAPLASAGSTGRSE